MISRVKITPVELEFRAPEKAAERMTLFYEKYPNAWIKNYNKTHPGTGFFRIWDYGPRHLTDEMLNELSKIIDAIVRWNGS